MNNVACLIARTDSSRLPRKVVKPVGPTTLIEFLINKLKRSVYLSKVYLCTTTSPADDILVKIAKDNNICYVRGSNTDIIDRIEKVIEIEKPDNIVRVTGDNLFTDEVYIDLMLEYQSKTNADYTRTFGLPRGVTAEILSVNLLDSLKDDFPREFSQYLLLYAFDPNKYQCNVLEVDKFHHHPDWNLSVDTTEDFNRTVNIIGSNTYMSYDEIVKKCSMENIPHLTFEESYRIKFPGNVVMTKKAFNVELKHRINHSKIFKVSHEEYLSLLQRA